MPELDLDQRLRQVLTQIQRCAQEYGRESGSVRLLAVSKTHSVAEIEQLFSAGQSCFGENYVQEALPKIEALAHHPLEWHFIGQIQSNKAAILATHFAWVHSVCSLKVAQRLNAQRPAALPPLNICLQVNISQEATKAGLAPTEVSPLAIAIQSLPRLRLRGLMAIPAPCTELAQQRQPYRQLRELLAQLQQQGLAVDTLSMGMSADLAAAIAEGATWVRVGTALFGPRGIPGDIQP